MPIPTSTKENPGMPIYPNHIFDNSLTFLKLCKMPEQTKAEKDLLLKKHERAMKLRAEYIKQSTNPFRHATGEGGTLFDVGIQRYQSMRCTQYDHFKPTTRSIRVGAFTVVLPIIIYAWMLKSERDKREHLYRTGQVSYKDRNFKFI